MDGVLEAAMEISDDEDDDTEMDWNKEEDELMKGVYSHFQGGAFPDFKAGAIKSMSMLSNPEASSSTMSTRDISRNHITAVQNPRDFGKTDVPVQLRNRCKSAMRGLGYGSRIGRSAVASRLAQLPPVSLHLHFECTDCTLKTVKDRVSW